MLIQFASCGKALNKRITLWRNDKIPYGTYYAYNNLHYLFKNSQVVSNDKSPESFDQYANSTAYIIIGHSVRPSESELKAILSHAIGGNHVFISAMDIGQNLLDSFKLEISEQYPDYFHDSLTVSIFDPVKDDSVKFTFPGVRLDNYFTKMDTSVTNILGRSKGGYANFVKFTYQGGGTVLMHLAPGALTNYFLLHKDNKKYYDLVLSSVPDTVEHVVWDDYYRHHINGNDYGNKSAFSKLAAFLENDVLRWAFWLAVVLFVVIYLFESKRKQRIIPSVKKLNNTSLDFVKTIGRLYYQRKDNKNLALKISTHFLGHIRSRYNMATTQLDNDFIGRLAFKSGYPVTLVKSMIDEMKKIDESYAVTDQELLAFNDKIDTFINKA
ncbi:MAG TPA: DUF4350 domain-containing protein [Flavitalea sp.]|nr:DUF4350 domain-containing protein [Flavitalea sp.]